jgi:hypothetical protein
MSNRYDDRKIFKNANEMYERVFDERDVRFIRHYGSPNMRYPTIPQLREIKSIQHIWKVGDRFYKLASSYYSNPQYWWVIAQYNKRPTESDLIPGNLLYIPLPLETVLGFYLR